MTSEARAFLDQLDELACRNDQTSKDIFAVLTGLRSYDADADNGITKAVTTIPIRRAAFPKLAVKSDAERGFRVGVGENHNMQMSLQDPGDAERVDLRGVTSGKRQMERGEWHFMSHAKAAGDALGLRVVR